MKQYNAQTEKFADGLHFVQAPQGTTGEWAVFTYDGNTGDEIMGGADDVIETAEIRFNLFTDIEDGGYTIGEMIDKLTNRFDWRELFVRGYDYIKMQRMAISPILYIDSIWQTAVLYELSICKE